MFVSAPATSLHPHTAALGLNRVKLGVSKIYNQWPGFYNPKTWTSRERRSQKWHTKFPNVLPTKKIDRGNYSSTHLVKLENIFCIFLADKDRNADVKCYSCEILE